MKKLMLVLFAVALVFSLGAGTAQALPINITVDAAGNLLNTIGIASETEYDPLVTPPPSNNPDDNLDFLKAMISRWNGVPKSPSMPAAGALALDQGSLGGITAYTGPAGYQYVVFHWGGQGGYWGAYYLGGQSISFSTPPQLVTGAFVGGFSSARYFGTTSVPDGGATLMLLGGALVGLGALRRKFRA